MSGTTHERIVDALSGTAIASATFNSLAVVNEILHTLTLLLGVIAGFFAVFFHVRRYVQSRRRDQAESNDGAEE